MSCNLWTLSLGGKPFKFSHLIFFFFWPFYLLPSHPFPVFNPISCWELCWSNAPPSQFLGVHCPCQAAVALQTTAWKTQAVQSNYYLFWLPFLVTSTAEAPCVSLGACQLGTPSDLLLHIPNRLTSTVNGTVKHLLNHSIIFPPDPLWEVTWFQQMADC